MQKVTQVSEQLREYVSEHSSHTSAGTLVGGFCSQHKVDRPLAEMALAVLLNQGRVEADRDFRLVPKDSAA